VSLDALERHYGVQSATWPTDPWLFLVWWICGYPASDVTCAKGWAALNRTVGTEPANILAASPAVLAGALKTGGLVPELRAERLKEVAYRVLEEFGGDLADALRSMPLASARSVLKSFSGIADPGADRILLFSGISPMPAVPSSSPQVVIRMQRGRPSDNYGRNYKHAQQIISESVPLDMQARMRAFLLLKCHGEQLCKRSTPRCMACPVEASCAYANGGA